jgi:2-phospho-L-lactate guanylyltransferase (CobY/MobA/RfbA family)
MKYLALVTLLACALFCANAQVLRYVPKPQVLDDYDELSTDIKQNTDDNEEGDDEVFIHLLCLNFL